MVAPNMVNENNKHGEYCAYFRAHDLYWRERGHYQAQERAGALLRRKSGGGGRAK